MDVAIRGGDDGIATRLRDALRKAGYTVGGADPAVVIASMEAIAGVRAELPRAAVVALLPDTLDVRAAFEMRDALDSVIPISMLGPDALRGAIERAISRREARTKQFLVDFASDGMALVSKTGITLYVNPAFEKILGRPASEIVGKRAGAFTHPEDVASGKPPSPGGTVTRLGRSLHKDGTYRWLESVIRDCTNDPNVGAYVVTFRDVTDHRAIERAALVTQRRLEYLLSSTRAITYSCVPRDDFRVTFISESVRDVLGWQAREFVDDPRFWWDRLHPEDRDRVVREVEACVATGAGTLEYRFRHADGSWRWMQDDLRIFSTTDGGELIGYWADVTEQRAAAEKLRRSDASFRALIESSPVATFIHRRPTIVYANPACAAMLGYESPAEMLGLDGMQLVHPDDRSRVRGNIERTSEARATTPSEIRLLRKDGSIVLAEGHGTLLDFDGVPSHVVMNRDVTERRVLFERAAAADRMRAVGALAASVAHEINSPLGFVANALQLLAQKEAPAEDRRALVTDAIAGTERIASITSSLRTMSHASDEAVAPVDVVAAMKFALKMLGPEIGTHLRIVEDYAPDLPRAHAQSGRLGQVFVNLLLNATQAMREEPQGEIRISARREGDAVRVAISDTGPGVPESVRARVFEPFFTTKPVGLGSGLGLAISRSIVAGFGGTLALESSAKGATFVALLPAVARASKLRILLLDDDAAFVRTLRMMLERDHDVRDTTDTREALAAIESGERFDAILCDMTMPAMTGAQFHARVEELGRDQARRIVFVSGATGPEVAAFFARTGNPRLQKPFRAEELERVLGALS